MSGVKWNPQQFQARLVAARDAAAEAAALALSNTIKASMPGLQRGKPSKPGRFPNKQTGQLSNSMSHTKGVAGVAYAGSDKPYARYLNNGTTTILPRPWARLGIAKARKTMNTLARAAMRRSLAQ